MPDWIDIKKDKKHLAREKERAREMRKSQWWRQKVNDGICHYCDLQFDKDQITMDHVVPLVRGGKSNKRNIVPCCKECNNKKKYLTPVEMLLGAEKK